MWLRGQDERGRACTCRPVRRLRRTPQSARAALTTIRKNIMAAKLTAKQLIHRAQLLWDRYYARPTKTNLLRFGEHLEVMKSSTAKSVKAERARGLRAYKREMRESGWAPKKKVRKKGAARRRNPGPRRNPNQIEVHPHQVVVHPDEELPEILMGTPTQLQWSELNPFGAKIGYVAYTVLEFGQEWVLVDVYVNGKYVGYVSTMRDDPNGEYWFANGGGDLELVGGKYGHQYWSSLRDAALALAHVERFPPENADRQAEDPLGKVPRFMTKKNMWQMGKRVLENNPRRRHGKVKSI